jgi:hypothetical protein
MPLVLLTVLIFFVFGGICAICCIPSILWAIKCFFTKGERILGTAIIFSGLSGVLFCRLFVHAVNSGWLPTDNMLLCWLHFIVPSCEPFRFYYIWVPIGFLGPATFISLLSGAYSIFNFTLKTFYTRNKAD